MEIEDDKWNHLVALDDELLKGMVDFSEWCTLIVREADLAFVRGAHLACVLTAVCAIETFLRSESGRNGRMGLAQLIDASQLEPTLAADLHRLRLFRNRWVHLDEPWDDSVALESPEKVSELLKEHAFLAVRLMRRTLYSWPGV